LITLNAYRHNCATVIDVDVVKSDVTDKSANVDYRGIIKFRDKSNGGLGIVQCEICIRIESAAITFNYLSLDSDLQAIESICGGRSS